MQFSHRHLDSYHVQSFVLAAYDYVESSFHAYRILPCCYNWLSLSLCLWLFFCWCCCSHTRCTENPCKALYLPGIKQGWLEYPHLVRWFSCYQPPFSSWQWTNSQRPPPPTYGKRCWRHVFFCGDWNFWTNGCMTSCQGFYYHLPGVFLLRSQVCPHGRCPIKCFWLVVEITSCFSPRGTGLSLPYQGSPSYSLVYKPHA